MIDFRVLDRTHFLETSPGSVMPRRKNVVIGPREPEAAHETLTYPEWAEDERPRTRGDCYRGPRPCPWVSCRYHLYLDWYPRTRNAPEKIKINFPRLQPWQVRETCALDVADRGYKQLQAVGDVLGITRERVRQIEATAIAKLRKILPPDEMSRFEDRDPYPAVFDTPGLSCAAL